MGFTIRRALLVVFGAALIVYQVACGGSTTGAMPTGPTGGSGSVAITILGINGNQSFSPATVNVPQGQTITFHNSDTTTHHIVEDTGAFDTGALAPGATSAPITINSTAQMRYHCTIHPTMVGALNSTTLPNPGGGFY